MAESEPRLEAEAKLATTESELRMALQKLHTAAEEKEDLMGTVESLKVEVETLRRCQSLGALGDAGLVEECERLRTQLEAAQAEQQRLMRMVLNGVDSAIATGSPTRAAAGASAAKKVRRKSLVPAGVPAGVTGDAPPPVNQ